MILPRVEALHGLKGSTHLGALKETGPTRDHGVGAEVLSLLKMVLILRLSSDLHLVEIGLITGLSLMKRILNGGAQQITQVTMGDLGTGDIGSMKIMTLLMNMRIQRQIWRRIGLLLDYKRLVHSNLKMLKMRIEHVQ